MEAIDVCCCNKSGPELASDPLLFASQKTIR